jgi:hypothetical protein
MTLALVLAIPAVALADNLNDGLDDLEAVTTTKTITAGSSFTNNFWIIGTGSNGCDIGAANDLKKVTFSITSAAEAGASASSLTFDQCTKDFAQSVTFTPTESGTYPVTLSKSSGDGTYTINANFSLIVEDDCPTSDLSDADGDGTGGNSVADRTDGTCAAPVTNTEPELTLPGNQTVEATGPSGAAFAFASLISASDTEDGDLTEAVNCSPASGSTFDFGTTTVECSVEDSGGLTDSGSFDVTVVDTTDPVLTLPANITEEATGPGGAAVTYSATASDLVDGDMGNANCTPASGTTFPITTTTVNCSATDAAGNTANGSFDVTVRDTTGPALSLPSNITTTATSNSAATVTYTATANDVVDGSRPVTCNPASGSSFLAGTTTVNCSAIDTRNNTSNGSFTVTVNYAWTGFFQPIDKDVPNKAKAGSVVPVKFSLKGDQGLNIFATGSPSVVGATGCASGTSDMVEEYAPANASGLKYDATADQYIYNWKTQSNYAGKCLQLNVKLADGSPAHSALFTFFK